MIKLFRNIFKKKEVVERSVLTRTVMVEKERTKFDFTYEYSLEEISKIREEIKIYGNASLKNKFKKGRIISNNDFEVIIEDLVLNGRLVENNSLGTSYIIVEKL